MGFGFVTKCTLTGSVKKINVEARSYCVVDYGNMKHPEAFEFCKKLNARLPLPRNKQEADEFFKISPFWTHVDARNPKKSSNKAEWVDAEGKPLGNRPVYLWGQIIKVTLYFKKSFFVLIFDLLKVGICSKPKSSSCCLWLIWN